jgi:uncharacterized protein (DUF924 family)
MDDPAKILSYWFNGLNDKEAIDKNCPTVKRWFSGDKKTDDEIREKFENDLIRAQEGAYKDWEETSKGRLALIVLFDQCSRNIYRGTPKMFEADSKALELTLGSIDDKKDYKLQLIERIFLYMPLMHAEQSDIQKLSLKQFASLVAESRIRSPKNISYFEYTFGYAQRHHDTIAQFGRFPHRNKILNRHSTSQEEEYLRSPGSGF